VADIIHLTDTAFTMLRGFLVVKWFSVIGTAYNMTSPLFLTYLSREVGSKVVNPSLQIKH